MKIYLIKVDSKTIGVAKGKGNDRGIEYFLRQDERTYNDFVNKDSMSFEKFSLLMNQLKKDLIPSFSINEVLEKYEGHEHISLQEEKGVKDHEKYYDLTVSNLKRDLVRITICYQDGGLFCTSKRGNCVVDNNTIRIHEGGGNSMVLHFDGVRKINLNGVDFYAKEGQ